MIDILNDTYQIGPMLGIAMAAITRLSYLKHLPLAKFEIAKIATMIVFWMDIIFVYIFDRMSIGS